eukprot:scaffold13051_cov41-Attheya_sp.AAC.1
MTSTPMTAYAKLAHVPVGAAFRITSGAYTDHVCLYRRVLMDFAVEVLIRKKKGLVVVSRHDSPSDYHPPTTLEPAVLTFDPALYNIAELPAMFAPLPPLVDTAGRLQDNSDGWEVRNPEAGVTVYSRAPTYYDECDAPPSARSLGHTGPGSAVSRLRARGIFWHWRRRHFPGGHGDTDRNARH